MRNVTIKGSDKAWPEAAVKMTFDWLEDLLYHNVQAFLAVADIAFTGTPPHPGLGELLVKQGVLETPTTVQTTRRDLARLMILGGDDPMTMRLARWEELEVTEVE